MRKRILVGVLVCLVAGALPALAGKNNGGAMIVHTNDAINYTGTANYCTTQFDSPGACETATARTDKADTEPAVIWFIAAFHESAAPGVTVCYFGNPHNLPPGQGYFQAWGYCAPANALEVPDEGWPENPAVAGNSVASPTAWAMLSGNLFPFYWFAAYGLADAYLGTGVNPVGGYAAFVSDDVPGHLDVVEKFGTVRWYAAGENECPTPPVRGACCLPDATCELLFEPECRILGGRYQGEGTTCSEACGACCYWYRDPDAVWHRRCAVTTQTDCLDESASGLSFLEHDGLRGTWSFPLTQCAANVNEADVKWWCQREGAIPVEETSWGKIKSTYR